MVFMKRNLFLLSLYAIAMALLEAAVVVYLRQLHYADDPLNIFPLEFLDSYDTAVELSREAATVAMILVVALLAERTSRTRMFAAFVFVFGLWDIFYYVWLKVLMDWPQSWWEWDVLFLIPTVWLGPWVSPALIALLFTIWGGAVLSTRRAVALTPGTVFVFVCGASLSLATFLQPALEVLNRGGMDALGRYTPGEFWWWLFLTGLALMSAGLWAPFRGSRRCLPRELVAAENQERTVLSRPSNHEGRRVVRTTSYDQ